MTLVMIISLLLLQFVVCNALIKLYGSQQTRSPLINWYLYEDKIPFEQKSPRPNNHPFSQVPFLEDDNGVAIFESGAILLYCFDAYSKKSTGAVERAKYSKWIVWANSELDGVCFGKGMSGTSVDKPNVRSMDVLEGILSKTDYLVDNTFSIADVAVASYLNYVPIFFSNVNMSIRPNIAKYMLRCAERENYAKAFGNEHAELVITKAKKWAASTSNGNNNNKKNSFW
jgi:glutathione S-transferase/alpha,alpha-trehalase